MTMTTKTNDFVNWLRQELNQRGWSYQDLADRAGFSKGAVGVVMSQRQNPGLEFCDGVAKAFHLPTEVVLRNAGLIRPSPNDVNIDAEFQEVLDIFGDLSEENRKDALKYMQYLLERHQEQESSAIPLQKTSTNP